ncbi:helix-turn-helix transcriptional regulator [Streptomyces sp. GbtcB6]|uniref:helix-turn-helix domain-containing protein n=1 Tax=Streptomyces sp. GbtcB6 TaxID=2824751 RepID=UPI001C2FA593|nr:helix-turn-helix transcriptional regulator [Streptomyces sp. GbtcB6]
MTVPALTPAQLSSFTLLLHDVRRVAGLDLVVGTFMDTGADHYVVDQLVGATSDGLRNLRVTVGAGLGGKAMLLTRPVLVRDYCSAQGISHDYDAAVRREGVGASFAVPIRVPRGPRGVLVGGLRHEHVFGDRVIGDVLTFVRALERDLAEDLALNRRLERLRAAAGGRAAGGCGGAGGVAGRRRLAGVCSELVQIASSMADGPQRRQIEALVLTLTDEAAAAVDDVLTAREREILAEVALGATNREVAARLGIGAETVKSSLASSMRKLGVPNRAALVAAALTPRTGGVRGGRVAGPQGPLPG